MLVCWCVILVCDVVCCVLCVVCWCVVACWCVVLLMLVLLLWMLLVLLLLCDDGAVSVVGVGGVVL